MRIVVDKLPLTCKECLLGKTSVKDERTTCVCSIDGKVVCESTSYMGEHLKTPLSCSYIQELKPHVCSCKK